MNKQLENAQSSCPARNSSAAQPSSPNSGISPRTFFARGSILGKAVARASASQLKHAIAQPFRSEQARAQAAQRTDEQTAHILFEACGSLRGTALKLAQVLAMEPELLPEAYRKEFSRAAHRAPPINRALVRKIIEIELGSTEKRFAAFENTPFAAASLGQVHAATSHSSQQLAVKIQYPGMAESVRSDLAAFSLLIRPSRLSKVLESSVQELRIRLEEELDYLHEAEQTNWFRQKLGLAGMVVPRVHADLTTSHVITTERIAGTHLTDWLATNPSQQARNHYGQLLADLFHHCVFDLHRIHADPNFGNYLFRADGRLGLLDFGCVRRLTPEFVEVLRQLFGASRTAALDVEQLHARLGIGYRKDLPAKARLDFLTRWGELIALPYRTSAFDFGKNDEYFAREAAMSQEVRGYVERFDGSFLYVGRAHHGLQRLLRALGATVRMNYHSFSR
jgi:predicted unusual protein kinase regulating ubiquinone biosynthesis (AarF/ABC1/UbiB family)